MITEEEEEETVETVVTLHGETLPLDECVEITVGDSTGQWVRQNHYDLGQHEGESFLMDEIVEFEGYLYHIDAVSYCDNCGEYYLNQNGECCRSSNDNPRAINEYHCSPSPMFYTKGDLDFCLGFEVEKNEVDGQRHEGDAIDEQPLFAGWETDSSCGVEGITNVYAIGEYERFANHVDQSNYCNEPADSSCGGHVNMSGNGLTLEKVRPYAGLFYALYRHRLNNHYSSCDKAMNKTGERYAAIREKRNNIVEFRLVSRVRNGKQLKWRFRLFSELAKAIQIGMPHTEFIVNCMPLLREVYPNGEHMRIAKLAIDFQNYLNRGIISERINEFI